MLTFTPELTLLLCIAAWPTLIGACMFVAWLASRRAPSPARPANRGWS